MGKARAENLSARKRKEIAKKGGKRRWNPLEQFRCATLGGQNKTNNDPFLRMLIDRPDIEVECRTSLSHLRYSYFCLNAFSPSLAVLHSPLPPRYCPISQSVYGIRNAGITRGALDSGICS